MGDDRGIGDNGGPPFQKFTARQKLEHITRVLEMDITAAQKCVGIGIIVEADTDWITPELSTERLRQFANVKDRETVYKATKKLSEHEVVRAQKVEGKANRYLVLPTTVVDAIVEAYNSAKTSGAEPDGVGDAHPVGSDPTTPIEPVGPDRTGQAGTDCFGPSPSRARGLLNNITNTTTYKKEEEEKEDAATPLVALEAFELYNAMAEKIGLPQARTLTPQRRKSLIARLREHGGIEAWKIALANVEKSAFLQGQNDRGWRADFDFLLQAARFTKVVEGTYGNGAHAKGGQSADAAPATETRRERIARYIEEAQAQKGRPHE